MNNFFSRRPVSLLILGVLILGGASQADAQMPGTRPTSSAPQWVDDLPGFLNAHPRQHWIIGRSGPVALSADEAEAFARDDAANQIAAEFDPALMHRIDAKQLHAAILNSLVQEDWVVDRQIDSTQRPYATIWKAAVLIDASPQHMDSLRRPILARIARQRIGSIAVVAFSAAWIIALALGFIILNWLTRGYFRGRLAAGSTVLLVIGILGAVKLLGAG